MPGAPLFSQPPISYLQIVPGVLISGIYRQKKAPARADALNKGENSCRVEVISYFIYREPRIIHLVRIFIYKGFGQGNIAKN